MPRTARTGRRIGRRAGRSGGALAALPAVAVAAVLSLAPTAPAVADEAPAAAASPDRPTRGMTKSQVEARYGAPTTKHDAVGNPPISRWDYPTMLVYFEHDHVVHAVLTPAG
jgi:hypothetical protein